MKKKLSPVGLLFISLSSMIGSGWLFGSLYSAHLAGPAAVLAWPLAAILLMFVALSYAEVATMFPHADNLATLPLYTHGRLTSVIMSGLAWLSLATIPVIETQGLAQYASNYIPGIMVQNGTHYVTTPEGYLFVLLVLFSFVVFNYFGVHFFARINAGLTIWKLIIPVLTVIVLFKVSYHTKDFSVYGGFMPYGWHGVMMAMSSGGALFSLLGFRQVVIMMSEIDEPGKYVPLVLVGSLLLTALLYIGLQWSFIGSMREEDLAQGWANLTFKGDAGPFAALAGLAGIIWLSLLLYADAFVSPYATGLVFSTTASHMLASMGNVKNAPEVLAVRNKHHAPWVSLIFNFLLATVMFLVLRNWQAMAAFIVAVQMSSYAVGPISLICLRKQLPDYDRPFRLKWAGLISFLGFYVCTAGVYWSGLVSMQRLLLLLLLGILFYFLYYRLIRKMKEVINFRNSVWLICYLSGLGVFAYYGNYGGKGIIPLYWDLLFLMGFSLLIYVMSIFSRLRDAPSVEN